MFASAFVVDAVPLLAKAGSVLIEVLGALEAEFEAPPCSAEVRWLSMLICTAAISCPKAVAASCCNCTALAWP